MTFDTLVYICYSYVINPLSTDSEPGRETVESWLASVRSDLSRLAADIEPLLAEQARLRDREALLVKLLQSISPEPARVPAASESSKGGPAAHSQDGSVLEYVRTCVLDILRGKGGGPMHINDIHARFLAMGFRVPGAGRPANLTAHLGRCPGITSPSRGFYAIGNPSQLHRRRRKRR